jgi:uncharacterized protein Yka (UPF0111/DUF47 family)
MIDDENAIACVLGDVRKLVDMQAQVQRVKHCAGRRNSEVRLEMPKMVPAERRDAITATDA